jgi:hypothetical protein
MNNASKRLKEDYPDKPATFEVVPYSEESNQILTEFFNHHTETWTRMGVNTVGSRFPQLLSFYQTIHQRFNPETNPDRHTWLTYVQVDGTRFGYILGWKYRDRFMAHMTTYLDTFKRYYPGLYTFDQLIQTSIQAGIREFAFGRGEYDYKFNWAKDRIALQMFKAFKTPQAKFLWGLDEQLFVLRDKLKEMKNKPAENTSDAKPATASESEQKSDS